MGPGNSQLLGGVRVCLIAQDRLALHPGLRREAESLGRNGCDVRIICLKSPGQPFRECRDGLVVYRLPAGARSGGTIRRPLGAAIFLVLVSFLALFLQLTRRISVYQFDSPPGFLVLALLLPRLAGARLLLAAREPVPERTEMMTTARFGRWLVYKDRLAETLAVRLSDFTLTPTREMRDQLGKKGFDVNRIGVVLSVPEDSAAAESGEAPPGGKIESIRREDRRQGVFRMFCRPPGPGAEGLEVVVRALAELKDRLPGIQCRIQAAAEQLAPLTARAAALKLKNELKYLGPMTPEKILEEMMACDVGLIPRPRSAYYELTHPPDLHAYIRLGKPVISSRLSSIAAYYPDGCIVYFEPGDEQDLADKIYQVFAHPEDLDRQVRAAADTARAYRWVREQKKYIGIFRNLSTEGSRWE